MKHHSRLLRTLATACGAGALALLMTACEAPKQGPNGGPSGSSDKSLPKLMIVGGDSIAWGRVPPGVLKYDLKIVNVGGDTLHILDVHPGCGCTTAPLEKKDLLPGDTSVVKVSLDATTRTGDLHKSLTIKSNDSIRHDIVLPLTAFIVREVTLSPEYFPVVDGTEVGKEQATSVMIHNLGTVPVKIDPPRIDGAPDALVRFDLTSQRTLAAGDSMKLTAFVKAVRVGTASANVTIPTDNKNTPKLNATITCNVHEKTATAPPGQPTPGQAPPATTPGGKPGQKPAKTPPPAHPTNK